MPCASTASSEHFLSRTSAPPNCAPSMLSCSAWTGRIDCRNGSLRLCCLISWLPHLISPPHEASLLDNFVTQNTNIRPYNSDLKCQFAPLPSYQSGEGFRRAIRHFHTGQSFHY